MTTWIMFDSDISPDGVRRRIKEEFGRTGINSDAQAAKRFAKPQQWVSRHMTGQTDWKLQELQQFCDSLGLDYIYVTTGIRTVTPPTNGGNVITLRQPTG